MKGMGGNMGAMLKQVQKMQQDIADAQEQLVDLIVEASSGGGMVTVKANGRQEITEISINPEAVDPEDVEMLEDMVLAAINEAQTKAAEAAQEHMDKVTGPLKGMMPPGMGIPGF